MRVDVIDRTSTAAEYPIYFEHTSQLYSRADAASLRTRRRNILNPPLLALPAKIYHFTKIVQTLYLSK